MRITGGNFKGQLITEPPKGISGLRPSMDMLRESVFSILDNVVNFEDCSVLDLYAGAGTFGFESISRGVKFVHFVDKRLECINAIKNTASRFSLENYKIFKTLSETFIKKTDLKFELVFVDPPYAEVSFFDFFNLINKHNFMLQSGILVYECDIRNLNEIISIVEASDSKNFQILTTRRYGQSGIIILRYEEN